MLTAAPVSKGAIGFGVVQGVCVVLQMLVLAEHFVRHGKVEPDLVLPEEEGGHPPFGVGRALEVVAPALARGRVLAPARWVAVGSKAGGREGAIRRGNTASAGGQVRDASRATRSGLCGTEQVHIQAHSRGHDAGKRGGVGCGMRLQPKQLEPRP